MDKKGTKLNYRLIRSKRAKYLRLSVNCDAEVRVTLPYRMSERLVENFLAENFQWIKEKIDFYKKKQDDAIRLGGGRADYLRHKHLSRKKIEEKIRYFNQFYKFSFNKITIKNQASCWGSCSADKNLNFNYRLALLPEELMEYVVVHELCHLKELNHGKNFWQLVHSTLSDYKARKKRLSNYKIKK